MSRPRRRWRRRRRWRTASAQYRAEEAPAHVAIGREKLARNDITGAMASFERARALDYGSPEARVALGEAYLARGERRVRTGALVAGIGDLSTAKSRLRADGSDELRQRPGSCRVLGGQSAGRATSRRR